MSTRTALATQPAKARKHRARIKRVIRANVFDRVQKDLQQGEEEAIRTKRSILQGLEEFN